ncbi:hypothetical protein [Glycomyces dulcitolivorans]|jgi:hypothetical protein|uniref:hypothetical protein n=1 Tax=Glycomyces dulcitolivorans TaxID=2200759 RepID=UPI000DD491C7|nr:hypothetical protein [Glycomyces dulcitolivorans]
MDGYSFQFLSRVRLEEVVSATSAVFGVSADLIEALDWRQGEAHAVEARVEGMPAVLIERDPDRYGEYVVFNAGEEFASLVGELPEAAVASQLCARLKARAVLAAPNAASDALWILVAEDGSFGEVLVDVDDLDEGVFTVTGAIEEIKGAPEIPVIGLPEGFNPYRT